ncbi:hypothetical protein BDN67DRAFT_965822 [Paxillus ammoniavirescens]|nr:hypothetical protein BDN67DRAFT_965822 [Paxillus ammoniavirescens]
MSLPPGKYIISVVRTQDGEVVSDVPPIGPSSPSEQVITILASNAKPHVWDIKQVNGRYTIHVEGGAATSPKDGQVQATGEATAWDITPDSVVGVYRIAEASGQWTARDLQVGSPILVVDHNQHEALPLNEPTSLNSGGGSCCQPVTYCCVAMTPWLRN